MPTKPKMTRREAMCTLGTASAALWFAAQAGLDLSLTSPSFASSNATPALAPGAPTSPERIALIDTFKEKSAGLGNKYEARVYKGDFIMPYRLFRPAATGKLPLVLFLHGSGGQGDDNLKQLGLGNIFGTRVWLLPENQKRFPCYVVVPQTDRGWVRYDFTQEPAVKVPGFGEGARAALEIVYALCHEFSIDEHRIYVTGQSMGGAGVWHMTAHRPKLFAAAVPCCGTPTSEPVVDSVGTPVWNFHGQADQVVPVSVSQERILALRKAGAHPLYTEYVGVDHNVWEWAYTEPELVKWVFSQRRG
jgi:predicted peptidase